MVCQCKMLTNVPTTLVWDVDSGGSYVYVGEGELSVLFVQFCSKNGHL